MVRRQVDVKAHKRTVASGKTVDVKKHTRGIDGAVPGDVRKPRENNPGLSDEDITRRADDLHLYISNDYELYEQWLMDSYLKNMVRKIKKGEYSRARALEGINNLLIPRAIKKGKEQGYLMYDNYPKDSREKTARLLLDDLEERIEYDEGIKIKEGTPSKPPRYSLTEMNAMTTISEGQFDDLKYDEGGIRVWLSRMTREDGMPYNNQVTVEKLKEGRWEEIDVYQAK